MIAQPDAFDSNNLPAPRAFHCIQCGANVVAACFCVTPDPRNTPRTDVHREGVFMPSDYTPVLSFGHFAQGFGFHIDCEREFASYRLDPADNIVGVMPGRHSSDLRFVCCLARSRDLGLPRWQHPTRGSSSTNCDVCGAWFMHGAMWLHVPTGEHIFMGHDCEDKYSLSFNRSGWQAWHNEQTRLRGIAAKTKKYKVAALRFLEKNPALAEALALPGDQKPGEFWGLSVLRDMLNRLNQYGSISDASVAYALKLGNEARTFVATPAPPPEPHVEAPEGRVTFKGTIISTKVVDGPPQGRVARWSATGISDVLKMTVKVEEPAGVWLCFVSVPSSLHGMYDLKGKQVELTATLTRSDRDYFFAFGKRPSGARIL